MLKSFFKSDFGSWLTLPDLISQCAVCRSWPARQVCEPCLSRFSPHISRCTVCALALPSDLSLGLRTTSDLCVNCIKQRPPLDASLVAVTYSYPWSELITRYKFGDRPGWSSFFADLLLHTPGAQQCLDTLNVDDLIIPMPLSAERLQSRGFNQAWELVKELVRQSNCVAQSDAQLLLRVRDTRPQTALQRDARLANVQGAFQVDPLRAFVLKGKRVVIVDDVMTSGASLFTAAKILQLAGAAHITALVIARTPFS